MAHIAARTHQAVGMLGFLEELERAATARLMADPNRDAILAKQKAARLHLRLHRITRGPFIHNGKKPTTRKARP